MVEMFILKSSTTFGRSSNKNRFIRNAYTSTCKSSMCIDKTNCIEQVSQRDKARIEYTGVNKKTRDNVAVYLTFFIEVITNRLTNATIRILLI